MSRLTELYKRVDEVIENDLSVWDEPLALTVKVDPEPYPISALPKSIREAVLEVAGFVQAPIPLIASSALTALSLAIQAHADVVRSGSLKSPTSLFLLTIAESGERKSSVDNYFMQEIRSYERIQAESSKSEIKKYESSRASWEAKQSGIKDQIRQQAKSGKSTTNHDKALTALIDEEPVRPRIPHLSYTDITPEALAFNLANNWPSGGVVAAEGGLVLGSHGMGKDSITRNLAMLNQLWDGNGLRVDRRSVESFEVDGVRLTVSLMVQAATLSDFYDKSGLLARGIGFFARFLVAFPKSTQGSRRFTDEPSGWPSLSRFNERIAAILRRQVPIDKNGKLHPNDLKLSLEAKNEWRTYYNEIEASLGSGGELADIRDIASKSADNASRIAALFQIFESGFDGVINTDSLVSASQIAAWHLNEARRIFGELALPSGLGNAVKLDEWLIDRCNRLGVTSIPKNEALQKGKLRVKQDLDAAIEQLTELNRVRLIQDGSRKAIFINPALLRKS